MREDGAVDDDDGLGGVHAVGHEGEEDGVDRVPHPALLGLGLVERDAQLHPLAPVGVGGVVLDDALACTVCVLGGGGGGRSVEAEKGLIS